MPPSSFESHFLNVSHCYDICLVNMQVLKGDINEAICTHALFYAIWKKYRGLPERFNWHSKHSEVHFYPLRPELIEATYLLYQVSFDTFFR